MEHVDNDANKMNYYVLDGIKIYEGTTEYNDTILDRNIEYYKNILEDFYLNQTPELDKNTYKFLSNGNETQFALYNKYQNIANDIFTPLISSTLTIKGSFSNILFDEEELIHKLDIPDGGYILKICCNYGEIFNKNPDYIPPLPKVRLSNRGRKPKIKKQTKRKLQGSGKYFSSQITFEIYNPDNNKVYKIKLFRNGGFQIPGVNKPDISDLVKPITILNNYLIEQFSNKNIKVNYLISVMRNYICKLVSDTQFIKLNEFETILKNNKKKYLINYIYQFLDTNKDKLLKKYGIELKTNNIIKEYIGEHENIIQLAEMQNNCERYFGLIIKFNRPVPWKLNKKTTIKILKSGKINIDGSNSIKESIELYIWLITIFIKYKNEIIHDTSIETILDSDTDYSIGSGYSIYDDEL